MVERQAKMKPKMNSTEWNRRKRSQPYTWVGRASLAERIEMYEWIAADNELEMKEWKENDPFGMYTVYELEFHKGWQVVAHFIDPETGYQGCERGGFARCNKCGHIYEIFEGQIEDCTDCGNSWEEYE